MNNKNYRNTILLPKTNFLIKNFYSDKKDEQIRNFWKENRIYQRISENNFNNDNFFIHDGPRFANGKIHFGHALNLCIKDIIIRFQSLNKKNVSFLLGWDTHGLPIEHKVLKEEKNNYNLRSSCYDFAIKQSEIQRNQLIKLGLFTDYEKFYLTLNKEYESKQIRIFGELVKKKLIYQGFRPIHWSTKYETALAEDEVEYLSKKDISLYFKMIISKNKLFSNYKKEINLLIWTTQPWTIPSNKLIAINKNLEYALIEYKNEYLIILKDRIFVLKENNNETKIKKIFIGEELIGLSYFFLYNSKNFKGYIVDAGDFVKNNEGSGLIHISPAFGFEDFLIAKKENIEITCPIDSKGIFDNEIEILEGMHYTEVNNFVILDLSNRNHIIEKEIIEHSYPHDWRDKSPLIYRLTKQLFIDLNEKEEILEKIEKVYWYPEWTKEKIKSTIISRKDWCISRQRKWGVPVPLLYNKKEEPILDVEIVNYISDLILEKGSEIWFDKSILLFLKKKFNKLPWEEIKLSEDTIDVWFDSGVSHFCVLDEIINKNTSENKKTTILYIEGQDQFRGWFNSSLITSVKIKSKAPYDQVLSHGFVVDEHGKKMSKSLGNFIDFEESINRFGSDIFRLWVISSNFTKEIKISHNILKNVQQIYYKIRNTLRFILGNLSNFEEYNLEKNLDPVDNYILYKLEKLSIEIKENYNSYNFTQIYFSLLNFCINDLSSFYFELSKDSLYYDSLDNLRRRKITTTFYYLFWGIIKIICPILPILSEEIYQHASFKFEDSIFLVKKFPKMIIDLGEEIKIIESIIIPIRQDVLKILENYRNEKIITSNSESYLNIFINDKKNNEILKRFNLNDFLQVSELEIEENFEEDMIKFNIFSIKIKKNDNKKCERCRSWKKISDSLCFRCKKVINNFS